MLFAEQIVGRMLDQGQRSAVMLQGRQSSILRCSNMLDSPIFRLSVRIL